MDDVADLLASIHGTPLLQALSAKSRARLLKSAVLHTVMPGTVLFEQGEMPNFQQIVLSGAVHLLGHHFGREVLIEVVQPPDLLIPAAVVTEAPYLMRARAAEKSQLLLILADQFRATVAREPPFAQAVLLSLARQFRRMVRQIKTLKLRSAAERVGCYILALSERQGTASRALLPYEKSLVASELGITRESFSRALAALRTVGVKVHGQKITIGDRARLAAQCRPDPLIDALEHDTDPVQRGSRAPKRTTRQRHG